MNKTMRTMNKGHRVMLENPERTIRCEFYTRAVKKSNVDDTIDHYEPMIRHCQKLTGGSTYTDSRTSVEDGNEFYKRLISENWIKVDFSTMSFA